MYAPAAAEGGPPSLGRACGEPARGRLMPAAWKSRLLQAHQDAIGYRPAPPAPPASSDAPSDAPAPPPALRARSR
eukprot:tig00000350_g24346.t1